MTNTISADDRVTGELCLFQSSSCPQLPDRIPTLLITKLPDGQLTTKLTQVSNYRLLSTNYLKRQSAHRNMHISPVFTVKQVKKNAHMKNRIK